MTAENGPLVAGFLDVIELAAFLGKKTDLQIFKTGLTMLVDVFPDLVAWGCTISF